LKPRIGITVELDGDPGVIDGASWLPYVAAVEAAGGEAVLLGRGTLGRHAEIVDGLQGLLFSGGRDVDLCMYPNPPDLDGEEPSAVMARYNMHPERERDAYELPLLEEGLQRDLPILGICRGCQVLNVGLGGRLVLDIPIETGTRLQHSSSPPPTGASGIHRLTIHPGTQLASILPPEEFQVCNSRHHQAVRVDETFKAVVSAVSPEDGIVEAIEVPGRRWAIGVQWHPEHPKDTGIRELYRPLFRAFVQAASG